MFKLNLFIRAFIDLFGFEAMYKLSFELEIYIKSFYFSVEVVTYNL